MVYVHQVSTELFIINRYYIIIVEETILLDLTEPVHLTATYKTMYKF